jgi:hypothetical protein
MNHLKSFFLYFVFPAVLLTALFWFGWGSIAQKKPDLVLANPNVVNLGRISTLAPALSRELTLLNTSGSGVTINRIYTDCACLTVSISLGSIVLGPYAVPTETNTRPLGIEVAQGSRIKINYVFSSRYLDEGMFRATAYVETDKSVTKIPITAQIVR